MIVFHLFLLLIFTDSTFSQDFSDGYRLGDDVSPKSYNIKIRPFQAEQYFLGEVVIMVKVKHSVKKITLNSKSLEITAAALDNFMNETGYEIQENYELLHLFYKDKNYVDPGEHFIYIEYKGPITTNSTGIFQSGDSIAAMFSATYARMAFPCFDDPVHKAKFSVRIVKPDESYEALSNMEEINSFRTDGGIAVDFRTTPPISPYVLCFLITKYNNSFTNHRSSDGRLIPIRLFLMDEYAEQSKFLLEVAKRSLRFFEEYTNLPYPSTKLDIIELKDFNAEGEENIGLITLGHNVISFKNSLAESKPSHLRNAALLIVHEIAHMWFGDAVTHNWYNDLWLTEGFAEFMEQKGLQHIYPQWIGLENIFRQRYAFYNDIYSSPITLFPHSDEKIEEQFRELTYVKGSSVLNMLEMVMGPAVFKQGVRRYLKDNYLHTATTGNFINIMQQYSPNFNIRSFLISWLYQNSYPLVIVTKNNDTKQYILKQIPFPGASNSRSMFGHKWTIPITYTSSCNGNISMRWFDRDAEEIYITPCDDEKWIKFNQNGLGYYRVLYTKAQYQQLLENFQELTSVDQGHLIDDTFHLMQELLLSCEIPLKLVGKMTNNTDLYPVSVSLLNVDMILDDVKGRPQESAKLKKYFINIFENTYKKLSWTVSSEEDINKRTLRTNLFEVMCGKKMIYERCLEDAFLSINKNNSFVLHADLVNIYAESFKNVLRERKHKTPIEYGVKYIVKHLLEEITSIPGYIAKCSPWILSNL